MKIYISSLEMRKMIVGASEHYYYLCFHILRLEDCILTYTDTQNTLYFSPKSKNNHKPDQT